MPFPKRLLIPNEELILDLRPHPVALALPVLVALVLPGVVAASIDLEPRDVIATGDAVPGFGRIGTAKFEVLGIDERGRILVGSELSSGEEILLLADGRKIGEGKPGPITRKLVEAFRHTRTRDGAKVVYAGAV